MRERKRRTFKAKLGKDGERTIRASAVDGDDFVVARLPEERAECLGQRFLFVVGRDDDGDHGVSATSHAGKNFLTSFAHAVGSSAIDSNRSLKVSTILSVKAR